MHNTCNDIRHWRVIQTPFGENRLPQNSKHVSPTLQRSPLSSVGLKRSNHRCRKLKKKKSIKSRLRMVVVGVKTKNGVKNIQGAALLQVLVQRVQFE